MVNTFFVNRVADFIYDRSDSESIKSKEDVQKFWNNFYSEFYMDNPPWQAKIFIDGEWKDVTPTIGKCIQQMRSREKN